MPNDTNKFRKILVAVDLTKESALVLRTAHLFEKSFDSELHLVHVVEPVIMNYNDNMFFDFSTMEVEIEKNAKAELKKLGGHYLIPGSRQHLLIGRPATEIHALATKLQADLIVIGTHGQSGLALMLGSTANSVLHGSKCDVLAVRVPVRD